MNGSPKIITRTIRILSLVSLFTDFASEMLYPVMPVYLQHIGFSVLLIGILEGVAEAVAGLSKSYFGKLSDQSGKRLPFVQLGYALSAVSKPMMAFLTSIWWVFSARTIDRLGKGIRTGARDAMLSDEATAQTKGAVFGFHRSMDTFGAVLGPLTALAFLYFYPGEYRTLFLAAFVPGIIAVILTFILKERKQQQVNKKKTVSLAEAFLYWKRSPVAYRKLLTGLLLFALFNSSDMLLLLKIKEAGYDDKTVIGIYVFYNLVFALFAYPLGKLADKAGLKRVFLFGLAFFVITYTGFAFNHNAWVFLLLFFCYGIYAAATEGISKAWISNLVPKTETATAIGTYTGFQSIALLIASSAAGWLWFSFGPEAAFLSTALAAATVMVYFLAGMKKF
ncbi:MAG: MFS transporter [Chitinophagaceae bacterium]|nr:MFS transporter [Chitinophagaceae bacterium]